MIITQEEYDNEVWPFVEKHPALKTYLEFFLRSALEIHNDRTPRPNLYASVTEDFRDNEGRLYKAGSTIRVVMASRFGDVGITQDIEFDHGYTARLLPNDQRLTNWRDTP